MQINGAVALVTGANRGLGQAYARALVQRGAHTVYAGVRHPEDVSEPRRHTAQTGHHLARTGG